MTLLEVVGVFLGVGNPLATLFLNERIKTAVGEASAKTLADHKHEQDKAIEGLRSELQRRSTGLDLYTRERYRAYPKVYRRFRAAADALLALRGYSRMPGFESYSIDQVRAYLARNEVPGADADRILTIFADGPKKGAEELRRIETEVRRYRANDRYRVAVNAQILEELYCSDPVREKTEAARHAVAVYSESLNTMPGDPKRDEKGKAMEESLHALFDAMRSELKEATSASSADKTV